MGYATQILVLLTVYIQLRISSSNLNEDCFLGDPPEFTPDGQPPEAVWVDFGVDGANREGNLVLSCEVMGSPTPTVSWFREGQKLVENDTLSIRVNMTTASSDGTNYYCEATNMIGRGNSTTSTLRSRNVTVRSAYFQSREENVSTIVGGAVSLECAFSGDLLASNVRWFADDEVITEPENMQFLEERRYLYIPVLSETQRGMRYRCEVSDFLDENAMPIRAPATYTLNTDIANGSIVVYKTQSTVSGRVGQTVQLVFVAAALDSLGRIDPNVLCRESTPLVMYGTATGTTAPVTLTTAASNVDQVQFTCLVSAFPLPGSHNVVGTIIVSGPESPESPANITSSFVGADRDRFVGGGPVEYSCVASGSPAPTITWYYNGAVVQSGSDGVDVSSDITRLTIQEPQVRHSGIYQCFARNQFGDDSRAWILEVANPVIGMVILNSTSEIVRKPQGDLLYAPSGTANVTITTTLQSTTIRDTNTCGSCPVPQWKINGTDIMSDDQRYIFSSSRSSPTGPYTFTLTIISLTAETSGNYSVTVTLANFDISRESPGLFVTSLCVPVIADSDTEISANVGSELLLQCEVLDICETTVSWSMNGGSIPMDGRITLVPLMNGVAILRISSVEEGDAGIYTCTASSEDGSAGKIFEVTVSKEESNRVVIGTALGVVGGVLLLVGIGIVVMVIIYRAKKRKGGDKETVDASFSKHGSRTYTDTPHATASVAPATSTDSAALKAKEAVEMSNVGTMYADPKSIQHEAADTGQEYAVSAKRKPKTQEVEQQPAGDLYSVPDKTKKKQNEEANLMYAEVEARPPRRQASGNKQQPEDSVTYSDIAHPPSSK